MMNLATSITMVALNAPVFLDTWGTSLVVMTGGFAIGACAGIIYNLIMAYTFWGTSSVLWAGSSILVAGATYFFWKRGWVDIKTRPSLRGAGIVTGLINTVLVIVNLTVFHLTPTPGQISISEFLAGQIANPGIRELLSACLIEIADTTISLVLAAVIALLLSGILRKYHPDRGE